MKPTVIYLLSTMMVFILSGSAQAGSDRICVFNQTSTGLHVFALDASRYEADVNPGATVCSPGGTVGANFLLVVTRYVPVAKDKRPGWTAQCKAAIKPGQTLAVRGSAKNISCAAE